MARKKAKKATRGPRGGGSVFPDHRRGGYVAKVPTGRGADGKLTYTRVRAATQAEAVEKRNAVKPPGPTTTVSEWCAKWLKSLTQKPQTRDEYEVCVRLRIVPALGSVRLTALTPFAVEAAAKTWREQCGAATVRKTLAALSGALQAAHRDDLTPRNAARAARRPAAKKTNIDPFTPAELLAVIAAGTAAEQWRTFAACAATGMRVGEAMALSATAYNPTTGAVTISRTRTRRHGYGPPKSARGNRTVPVPLAAREAFRLGIPPTTYTTAHDRWRRLLLHLGLRHRNPHQLRHTWASIAIANGAPIADVAKALGDTVQVVVRTYLHPSGADIGEVMNRVFAGG